MGISPFLQHREKVMGHYGTAAWMRQVVMALWNGNANKVGLSQIRSLDAEHWEAVIAMLDHYHRHGEDESFMALTEEVRTRMAEERKAEERKLALESWMRDVRSHMIRTHSMFSYDAEIAIDNHYHWLDGEFDKGSDATAAAKGLMVRLAAVTND